MNIEIKKKKIKILIESFKCTEGTVAREMIKQWKLNSCYMKCFQMKT